MSLMSDWSDASELSEAPAVLDAHAFDIDHFVAPTYTV
jgi:hypothetical protein